MDKYLMSDHKLYWHLDRVNDWTGGKRISPIHIDVGLSKGCNINCEYCFGSLQGNTYKEGMKNYFPREALLNYMESAGKAGVRSMAFIGEGEPLLNPNVYDAIALGKKSGVDISLGTNGILFDKGEKGRRALSHLSWIRFNISAATEESYERVHRSKSFAKAIESIKFCVDTKKADRLDVTIGLQMVLTPSNVDQVVLLAKLGKELGVDYFVVKQCSDTTDSELGIYENLSLYATYENELKLAESISDEEYNVIIKWKQINNEGFRCYKKCLGAPFLLYSSGDGKLFPCGMFFEEKSDEFILGDLTKNTFEEIINSDRYWAVMEKMKAIDVITCYSNCKTHSINEFLWKISNVPPHVNFI